MFIKIDFSFKKKRNKLTCYTKYGICFICLFMQININICNQLRALSHVWNKLKQ